MSYDEPEFRVPAAACWRDLTAFDVFTLKGKRLGPALRGNNVLVCVEQGESYRALPKASVQLRRRGREG